MRHRSNPLEIVVKFFIKKYQLFSNGGINNTITKNI